MPDPRRERHLFRRSGRLLWLAGELMLAALRGILQMPRLKAPSHRLRAQWLQSTCRRVLKVLNVKVEVHGPLPQHGLLACNHLSYLDILVISALTPAVFVAKREVRRWPVFGWFAHRAGTIFVHRERQNHVSQSTRAIKETLAANALVVIFPEGTSTNGERVLPFKSSLLAEGSDPDCPVFAGCLHYTIPEGDAAEEACFCRDMLLVPHLLNLFGKRHVQARVSFSQIQQDVTDRKQLAETLHAEVARMHAVMRQNGLVQDPQNAKRHKFRDVIHRSWKFFIPFRAQESTPTILRDSNHHAPDTAWMIMMQAHAEGISGWDMVVTGYDFALLTPSEIQTWLRTQPTCQGPLGTRLAAMTSGDMDCFEASLWAACAEATGAVPRPGTSRWAAAQDHWRFALLQNALATLSDPATLAVAVEEIYERVGCPEDMLGLWHRPQPWEETRPATADPAAIEAFLQHKGARLTTRDIAHV